MIKRENSVCGNTQKKKMLINYKMYFHTNKSYPNDYQTNSDFFKNLYNLDNIPIVLFFYDIDDFGENERETKLFRYLRSKIQSKRC